MKIDIHVHTKKSDRGAGLFEAREKDRSVAHIKPKNLKLPLTPRFTLGNQRKKPEDNFCQLFAIQLPYNFIKKGPSHIDLVLVKKVGLTGVEPVTSI